VTYSAAFKKQNQNLINQAGTLIFRGEDAYGNGKTFVTPPVHIGFN